MLQRTRLFLWQHGGRCKSTQLQATASSSSSTTTTVAGGGGQQVDSSFGGSSSSSSSPPSAPPLASNSNRERLVILGSGWGGYPFLKALDTRKYQAILVSPRNHFLFTPLLANAAVGGSDIASICQPVRTLCADKGARFYEGKAIKLDKENKLLTCKTLDGRKYPLKYDKLIISVGFQANDFGMKQLSDYAFFMKETADARRVHDHIMQCFEDAATLHAQEPGEGASPEEVGDYENMLRRRLSFVTVGGGPTGTEFCAELANFVKEDVIKLYPYLAKYWSVHLVEAGDSILRPFNDEKLQKYGYEHLTTQAKVQVHLNSGVEDIMPDQLFLKTGQVLDFSTLVWCAGIKPLPFVAKLDLAKNEKGSQLLTDGSCKVKGEDSIYAIGDCAAIEGYSLPQTAQIAAQQAYHLAQELNFMKVDAPEMKPFRHVDKGTLAYVGGTNALYRSPSKFLPNLTGKIGYFTWRSAYWSMQLSMRNRMLLAADWSKRLVFGRDLTRLGEASAPKHTDDAEPGPTRGLFANDHRELKGMGGGGGGGAPSRRQNNRAAEQEVQVEVVPAGSREDAQKHRVAEATA
ncbi:unnamed protein product [Amoebophrya sp. A25]|nr:unnamed protein product [Amoebophrya sp. A25]|eukprot:GSA25T00023790001.1